MVCFGEFENFVCVFVDFFFDCFEGLFLCFVLIFDGGVDDVIGVGDEVWY